MNLLTLVLTSDGFGVAGPFAETVSESVRRIITFLFSPDSVHNFVAYDLVKTKFGKSKVESRNLKRKDKPITMLVAMLSFSPF